MSNTRDPAPTPGLDRRRFLAGLAAGTGAALLLPARPVLARTEGLTVPMRNPTAKRLLTKALNQGGYFSAGDEKVYTGERYESVVLRELDSGYLAQISGEGGRDFKHSTVVKTAYESMTQLPQVYDGAKVVKDLAKGTDPVNGLPYRDTFFMVDLGLFYGTYAYRMYKLEDGPDRTVCCFEKLTPEIAGAKWSAHQPVIQAAIDSVKRRMVFGGVQEVTEVYGMYVITPGTTYETRVTLTARLRFGDDASFVARLGSEMPPVIRSGLRNGFDSCCLLAERIQPA